MHYAGIFLKLTLWFLILGPTLFVFFFIPATTILRMDLRSPGYLDKKKALLRGPFSFVTFDFTFFSDTG